MIIVPGQPALQETRHSRELSRRVDDVISDYRRANPDVSEGDVRTALLRSAPPGGSPDVMRRKKAALVGVMAAVVGAFTAMSSNGGKFNNQTAVMLGGAVVVAAAVAFAVLRLARSD